MTIDSASFAQAMARHAPFEPAPVVAVALSGGPDSMALTLLLDEWTRRRGGSVLGLTVDHGLRAESAAEARQVGDWLGARGVAHQILHWTGPKPTTGLQSAARRARYDLLVEACASRGILHLALAHHADDQAETVLFRRDRGSGEDGLAGMSASRTLGAVRLIRPLLGWRKAALVTFCQDAGLSFFTDPSNQADRFARTGLRRRLAADQDAARGLLAQARGVAHARQARGAALTETLARLAEIRPYGAVLLDWAKFCRQGPSLRAAILAATVRSVGGGEYAPVVSAVSRLDEALARSGFRGASLAGCAVRRWRDAVLLCREPGRVGPPIILAGAAWQVWDRRFRVRAATPCEYSRPIEIGALGQADFATLRRVTGSALPAIVGAGLPAARSGGLLLAVPALGWTADGAPEVEQLFSPLWPLTAETFTVV